LKARLQRLINRLQRLIFAATYLLFSQWTKSTDGWLVVGLETASMLRNLGRALPNSCTVNLAPNRFYDFQYDVALYSGKGPLKLLHFIHAPYVLARLVCRYDRIFYLAGAGLIEFETEGRRWEFGFLKRHGKRISCYFTGSEIRSVALMTELGKRLNREVVTTYQSFATPGHDSAERESRRRNLGQAADEYAEHIFNPPVDQIAYIKRQTHPFLYFVPDDIFYPDESRFDDMDVLNVVHAPSSPLIKGTPLVRAAVRRMHDEGYRFNYVELIGVPHAQVVSTLRSAHIVLNEYYAFLPGVFGVEAMANKCALLTSADPEIERTLPEGAAEAWVVTPYWLIYDKLKAMLDDKSTIRAQARRGYDWTRRNYHMDAASAELRRIVS
jgi:glycosyltransferase involved in cell wall biosynthesis